MFRLWAYVPFLIRPAMDNRIGRGVLCRQERVSQTECTHAESSHVPPQPLCKYCIWLRGLEVLIALSLTAFLVSFKVHGHVRLTCPKRIDPLTFWFVGPLLATGPKC